MERVRDWWNRRWVLAMLVGVAIIPLLWPTVPPLVDLPGHMARYRVQPDYGDHPWLRGWYAFHWQLIGNLGVDLLVAPLGRLFGIELSIKLIVMTIPAPTVSGLRLIARARQGRVPETASCALPISYRSPVHCGFATSATPRHPAP